MPDRHSDLPVLPNFPKFRVVSTPTRIGLMVVNLIATHSLCGTTTVPLDETYQLEIWNAQDDLTNRTINGIAQDRKGYLWLATRGGLIRFDGRDFSERNVPVAHRPRGSNIRSIASSSDGEIIFQPTSASILSVEDRGLPVHPVSELVSNFVPHRMFGAADGSLWISTRSGNVLRWSQNSHHWFNGDVEPAIASITPSFAEDSEGKLWINTASLGGTVHGDQIFPFPDGIDSPILLASGNDGSILIFEDDRLLRYRNGQLDTITIEVPWSNAPEQLSNAATDSYGTIWIAAGRFGLLRWNNGQFHPAPDAFPVVNDLFKDHQGNIWVASEGNGFGRVQRRASFLINRASGLSEEISTSLHLDRQGTMWIANANGGLYKMVNGVPEHLSLNVEQSPLPVNALSFDHEDTLWIGNANGLYRSNPPYSKVEQMSEIEGDVHLLYTAQNGDLWFATTFGKFGSSDSPATFGYYRSDTLRFLSSGDGYNGHSIMSIEEGADGEIWASTYDGDLLRYRNGSVETIMTGSSIPDMHYDSQGNLWLASLRGLVLWKNGEASNLNQKFGYTIGFTSTIMEDPNGTLWYGLYHFPKDKLLTAVSKDGPAVSPTFAGGMSRQLDLSFLVNWFPTSVADDSGKLWFATSRGVLVFDPSITPPPSQSPQLHLDSIAVNGEAAPPNERISIPPGEHRFETTFSIPYFSDPRNVQVRYRLKGAGENWLDAQGARSISYSALAPGNYELQIQAAGTEDWIEPPLSVALRVLPFWWQTLWFQSALILAILAVTAIAVRRWSQRRLRERLLQLEKDQALERERTRIARDLHDDLGGGLSALQLLASRIARKAAQTEKANLNRLAERARRLNADVHSIVWLFTPGDGTLRHLAELILKYTSEVLKDSGIECDSNDPNSVPAVEIPPDAQHNIFFAAKEAVTNMLKHSQATQARLSFTYQDPAFHCDLTDNGKGFGEAVSEALEGNGLSNMKARLAEVGGKLEIVSRPGNGTTIKIRYLVKPAPAKP